MKKFLLPLLALFCAMTGKAQNEVMSAILQTGDEVTMFTGPGAFASAVNSAAASGSIITLSPGEFNAPGNISKSFTVYGAGWEEDADNGIDMITKINGKLKFTSSVSNVWLEGLYVNGNIEIGNNMTAMMINKCRFATFNYAYTSPSNITIRRCFFDNTNGQGANITNLKVQNCLLFWNPQDNGSQIMYDHCIISCGGWTCNSVALYTNSIINALGVSGGSTLKNCICTFKQPTNSLSEGCWFNTVDITTLFSDGFANLDYEASRTYALNDPETYQGTDGKAVGVSDGSFPWNKIPATPIIKSLELGVDGQELQVTYDAEVR